MNSYIPKGACATYLLALAFFLLPFAASADHTNSLVDQDTKVLTEAISYFSLAFLITSSKFDTYIPKTLERNVPNGTRGNSIGYSFHKNDAEINDSGVSAGILFVQNAEVVDDMYMIPAGTSAYIQAVVLFGTNAEDGGRYYMTLDEVPFYVGDERTPQHLNPSELKYHKTNSETVNYVRPTEDEG